MFEIDKLTQARLDAMLVKIPDNMPTFRGITIDRFDRENLIKLCKLFADEWHKAQEKYHECLKM